MTAIQFEPWQRIAARITGLALLIPFAIVVFAEFAIIERLNIPGDAVQTAQNILAHVQQFRIGIACYVLNGLGIIVLLTALYLVLRPVGRGLALVAAVFRLIYAGMWFLIAIDYFQSLRILEGAAYLNTFNVAQLQSLAKLTMAAGFDTYYVGLLFFGLASTVCSYLWLKSGLIPKALAIYGVLSSVWCIFCTLSFYVIPDFDKTVNLSWFDTPLALFEIPLGIWLLFRPLRAGPITA